MPPKKVIKARKPRKGRAYRKRNYRTGKRMNLGKYYNPRTPFPSVMTTQLVYQGDMSTNISSGASSTSYTTWRPNDMFDFDVSNNFGNKQPLYFDQLLSTTGPYKRYMVYAWKTTLTIFNLSDRPIECFIDTISVNTTTDADSLSEVTDRKGIIKRIITGQANAKPYTTISWYKTLKSLVPVARDAVAVWGGNFATSPPNYVSNSLVCRSIDGASGHSYRCKVSHVFYCKLWETDALQSA